MKLIRKWFENENEAYDIREYEGYLEARTETVLFMIVEPHDGTKNRWMLHVAPIVSFDRWANSIAVEEFFMRDFELREYLDKHQIDIYKKLLECLSNEYNEIYYSSME